MVTQTDDIFPRIFTTLPTGQSAASVGPYLMIGRLVAQRDDSHRLLLSLFIWNVACVAEERRPKGKALKINK